MFYPHDQPTCFRTYQHDVSHETPDYEKFRPYFGWVNVDTVQKTMEQSTQWGVSLPNTFPMKKHLKSRMGGHFFCLLKKMGRGIEPRLPEWL